jgi:hypothetical protein
MGRWFVLLIFLAGCTFQGDSAREAQIRDDLNARLAEVEQAQAAALALWDRVIFGEVVSCQEAIPAPLPFALAAKDARDFPKAAPVQDALNRANQAVRNSSDLWNIECDAERDMVPLDMARQGRQEALGADGPLTEARALLQAW